MDTLTRSTPIVYVATNGTTSITVDRYPFTVSVTTDGIIWDNGDFTQRPGETKTQLKRRKRESFKRAPAPYEKFR